MSPEVVTVLVASLGVQVGAAAMAIRVLSKRRGTAHYRPTWLLLSTAFLLLATLHAITLAGQFSPAMERPAHGFLGGVLSLAVSILLIVGVSRLARALDAKPLPTSENQYRGLFESNPQPTWVYDTETLRFLAVNDAALRRYGYSRAEFLSMRTPDIQPPEDVAPPIERRNRRRATDQPAFGANKRHRTRSGNTVFVEITSHAVDFDGVKAVLVLGTDVSEKLRAEVRLGQAEEQLRQAQKMEAVGRLAAGVAHDFNNLLTVISGYSALLLSDPDVNRRTRAALEELKQAGNRAAALTRQLLVFSRKQVLDPKVVDLSAVVCDVDKMVRCLIGADIDVVTILAPGLGKVRVDAGQMEQVLMNLVVNARDAMPEGGKLTIETSNAELDAQYASAHMEVVPGQYVMLAVSDNGCGMDASTTSRIFEPFFTTKEKDKGTGLGLATVYGIVRQSGGHIGVYSELGKGATFRVYLPRTDEVVDPVQAFAPTLAPRIQATETILLVEDDPTLRPLIAEILSMNGYHVVEAANGLAALSISSEQKGSIDLVITDLVMPEMGGVELLKQLVASHPRMKALFISGYTETAALRQGITTSDVAFLPKPFTPTALAEKVRQVLQAN